MFYNENVKQQFLDQVSKNSTPNYTSFFRRSSDYEEKMGKDIHDFNKEECMGLISHLNPKSLGASNSQKSYFKKYTNWCMKQGLTDKNYWSTVPKDYNAAKEAFRELYVKDLDELTEFVETTLSICYNKFVFYLLYMGIMGEACEELRKLREEDVKLSQNMINTCRRIHIGIIPPLREAIKYDYRPDPDSEDFKPRDTDSIYFIKPFKDHRYEGKCVDKNHISELIIRKALPLYKEYTGITKKYTATTIWRSGLFNELYQIERLRELQKEDYETVFEIYGQSIETKHAFLESYEMWKEVFWSEEEN